MDSGEFKDVFAAEARDYLQALNQNLLILEKKPDDNKVLDEMFRAAHSLKGMSSTMGYIELSEFTHQIESVFDILRTGELTATESINNILFKALDTLEVLLEKTLVDEELPEIRDMMRELENIIINKTSYTDDSESNTKTHSTKTNMDLDEYDQQTINSGHAEGYKALEVYVKLREKTLLKSVRVYTVFQALEQVGTIIKCKPSAQDLEEERFDLEFTLIILTKENGTTIKELVENITEIDKVTVTLIEAEEQESELAINNQDSDTPDKDHVVSAAPLKSKGIFHDKFIRVETERLDKLINLVGELVISKTQVMELETQDNFDDFKDILVQLDRITTELQYATMTLRMVPIKQVFDRFPRLVRDLAHSYDKDIQLEISGEETELDRSLVNQIADPLVHLIRNAIDHGIETTQKRNELGKPLPATLGLNAHHEGSHILIQVYDDGQGFNIDKIKATAVKRGLLSANNEANLSKNEVTNLVFEPGFSTNDTVTNVSGRGVGMDAVKNIVESLSGKIEVDFNQGEGSCITIKLPLTLAIIKALLVTSSNQTYAIPIESVKENLLITRDQIKTISQQQVIVLRNEVLPLIDLAESLGFDKSSRHDTLSVIVTESQGEKIGLIVDDLIGQQEIVIKSLNNVLEDISGISGATVLGNGKVALILDHSTLIKGRSGSVG